MYLHPRKYVFASTKTCICAEFKHKQDICPQESEYFSAPMLKCDHVLKALQSISTQCFAPTIVTNYKLRAAAWPPQLRPRNLPTVKLFLANHKIHKFTCHTFVTCDESHVMNNRCVKILEFAQDSFFNVAFICHFRKRVVY